MARKHKVTPTSKDFKFALMMVAQQFKTDPFTPMDILNRTMEGLIIVASREQVRTALDEIARSTGSVQRWQYDRATRFVCTLNMKQPEEFRYNTGPPVIGVQEKRGQPTMVPGMLMINKDAGWVLAKWKEWMERDLIDGRDKRYVHIPLDDDFLLAFGFKQQDGYRAKKFTLKGMDIIKHGARTYFTMGQGSDMRRNPVFHMGHVQEDYLAYTGDLIKQTPRMEMLHDMIEVYSKSQAKRNYITEQID